jgi:hypothetical protein
MPVAFEEETIKLPSREEEYPAPIPAPYPDIPTTLEFATVTRSITELEDPHPIAAGESEDDPDVAVTVEFKIVRSRNVDALPPPTPAPVDSPAAWIDPPRNKTELQEAK